MERFSFIHMVSRLSAFAKEFYTQIGFEEKRLNERVNDP